MEMMAMIQKWDYHAFNLVKNDNKYNTVAVNVQYGLSDCLMGRKTHAQSR